MNQRKPPALAYRLLDRLRYLRYNDPLAGDLQEEFESGRSGGWYWRQTLMIIARGMRRNMATFGGFVWLILSGGAVQLGVAFLIWRYPAPLSRYPRADLAALLAIVCLFALRFKSLYGVKWRIAVSVQWILGSILFPVMFGNLPPSERTVIEGAILASMLAMTFWLLAVCPPPEKVIPPIYPAGDLSLRVELSDGREIFLRPDNLLEQTLAAGDESLTAALFGRGASIEALRRAVWLGSIGRPQPVTIHDLAALVDEAADKQHVERAFVVE